MDPKELRGLYEAYSEVYVPQEVDEEYIDEAEGSYGQTPKARAAMGKVAIARREKPASEYSQKGEKTRKVKEIEKHTRRIDNGPDAGNRGKKSTTPRWSGYAGASGRGKMDQDARDYARERDVEYSGGENKSGSGTVTKNPKKLRKQKAMGEDLTVDVKEDVSALLNGEDLTEDFKFKAATIFEAAVKAKVIEELEKYEQIYQDRLNEEIEEIKESLETRVEAHLDYVSDQWLVENQLAVDNGLRSELSEEFILGIKNVFESCYVDIPEDKYDILGEMSERLDQMEEKLNEQIEVNVELNSAIGEFIKDGIIAEVSEGLAQTQKEKLASLAEGVEFISEESYREKIEMIKESYFHKSPSSYAEDLVEQTQTINVEGPMAAYAAALSKWSK